MAWQRHALYWRPSRSFIIIAAIVTNIIYRKWTLYTGITWQYIETLTVLTMQTWKMLILTYCQYLVIRIRAFLVSSMDTEVGRIFWFLFFACYRITENSCYVVCVCCNRDLTLYLTDVDKCVPLFWHSDLLWCMNTEWTTCVFIEGDKVAQYAGLHLHKRIVDSHCYSKLAQVVRMFYFACIGCYLFLAEVKRLPWRRWCWKWVTDKKREIQRIVEWCSLPR